MKAPYKYTIDTDHSGNSIYNVSRLVGNDFVFPELHFDRNLEVTTCDNPEGKTGNLLLHSGQGLAENTDSGYVHIWAGRTAQPFSDNAITDGIIVKPDTNIHIESSAESVLIKSAKDTKIESSSTINFVRGASHTTYSNDKIWTRATLYDLDTTNIDIDNNENTNLLTKTLEIATTLTGSGDNYANAKKFSLDVTSADSKMLIKDIRTFGTIDALHENISGNIVIGNTYTNGIKGNAEKYDRTFTAKGSVADIEYNGIQQYVHGQATDVFRLIAFGSKKPTIVGENVSENTNYSKLTIQHIDALKTFNFKGTQLTLGSATPDALPTTYSTDIDVFGKTLEIKSKDTDEYHSTLDVYAGFDITKGTDATKEAEKANLDTAKYHLAVSSAESRLDLDKLYATTHIDSNGTLTVTGLTTLNGNLKLKDSITAINSTKSLTVNADSYTLKSVTTPHEYIKVTNSNNKIALDSTLLDVESGSSNDRTIVLKNGNETGNKTYADDPTYTNLVGNSYLHVESAEIKNETISTSNIGTINNKTMLNVDGQVDIDSSNFALDSTGKVGITTTVDAIYNESHNGKYGITANTYSVVANKGEQSTITADNLKTNKTIKTDGSLDVDGLTTLSADIVLDNASGNLISATNGISIKSTTFDLKSTDASATSYFGAKFENTKINLDIKPDTIHIFRGKTTSAKNILDFDGTSATARVDDFHTTSATVDNMDIQDLDVQTKLHGKGNIDLTGSTSATLSTDTSSLTSSKAHIETHNGTYNLEAGGNGTYPLTITAGNSASTLTMTGATAHITGTTTLDGTKVNINAPVAITKTITLTGEKESESSSVKNSLITSDNKVTVESNEIILKSKTGSNNLSLHSTNGLTCTKVSKLHLSSDTLDIDSHHAKTGGTETYVTADHIHSPSFTGTNIHTTQGNIGTFTATSVGTTDLTTSGTVNLNATTLNSKATSATIKQKDSSVYLGYTKESTAEKDKGTPTDAKLKIVTTSSTSTLDFKGNTTLTGTLSTSGLTTATGGLRVSTINNLDGNLNMGITASNVLTLKGTEKLDASGKTLSFKFGTPNAEALNINVVESEDKTSYVSSIKTTNIDASIIGTKKQPVNNLVVNNIEVLQTITLNGFKIYWDEASQSIVFEKA